MKEINDVIKNSAKNSGKKLIAIAILLVFCTSLIHYIITEDATYSEGNPKNVPNMVGKNTNNIGINPDGEITRGQSAQELWDEMVENGSNVEEYLRGPEELQILMNAETVIKYLDTRPDPTEAIDWDAINKDVNSKEIQGIVKLARAKANGIEVLLKYTDPETYESYINAYNSSPTDSNKQRALNYYTLVQEYVSISKPKASDEKTKWPTTRSHINKEFVEETVVEEGKEKHTGIDIAVDVGTEVYAAEPGTVTTAGSSEYAGNIIIIDHGNGYVTKYMHNSSLNVSVGEKVTKGQVIALSGNSGSGGLEGGAHLHFEVEFNGTPVDPLSFKFDNGMGNGTGGIGYKDDEEAKQIKIYAKVAYQTEVTDTQTSNDPTVNNYSKTTYKMQSSKVNYEQFTTGYKMPFDYLWALLLTSQEKEFVFELAELVYDSDIKITIHENISKNTSTSTETYTKKTKTITDNVTVAVKYSEPLNEGAGSTKTIKGGPFEDEKENTYSTTRTIITTSTLLDIKLTKANTWIVDYTQEFNKKTMEPIETSSEENAENEEYPETPNKQDSSDSFGRGETFRQSIQTQYEKNYTNVTTKIVNLHSKHYYKKINRTVKITDKTESQKYESSPPQILEKTDEKAEEDNFVKILIRHSKARNSIGSVANWLFDILAKGPNTVDMVDLTKYLLYKATGANYGVTEFDFSIFDPAKFILLNSGIYGNSVEEKVWFTMINAGYSKEATAGAMGNFWGESGFKTNNLENTYNTKLGFSDEEYTAAVDNDQYTLQQFISDHDYSGCGAGYGLAQWTSGGRKKGLYQFAKSRGVSIADENMQIAYMMGELGHSEYADGYARRQLYNNKGYTVTGWKNAPTPEYAAEAFCWLYERPAGYNSARSTKAREYYEKYKDLEPGGLYVEDPLNDKRIIGQFTSGITGRTFTIFNQNKIVTDGYRWVDRCNRAAQISIVSGYYNGDPRDLIDKISANAPRDKNVYDLGGLVCKGNQRIGTDNTFSTDKLRTQIQTGGYALIYVRGNKVGDDGVGPNTEKRDWAYSMHWVAILGYNIIDGQEVIFASDSAHGNTGWVPLNEFDTLADCVVFVNEKQ